MPSFVFRKLLHLVAFSCTVFMILVAGSWQAATLASIAIAAILYPVLAWLERKSWFGRLLAEKRSGEIKRSLLMLFLTFAAVTAVSWGIYGRPYDAVAALIMWGTGDAAGALIGIPFGKHKIQWGTNAGVKSWEGTIAMFLVSCVSGLIVYTLYGFAMATALIPILTAALSGTVTEVCSAGEYDTVTVPSAILIILLLFQI